MLFTTAKVGPRQDLLTGTIQLDQISLLEMYKLIPSVLLDFSFELVEPEKEWTVRHGWFNKPRNVNVRVRRC